ncbi:hypothetical protein OI18_19140 [Flavihumibacter solisilvae]|uniref:Uncharacterized protein n=2 Tax=Flavihumibacter solisilvae TaxID=1349421 RepID=A0A0C1IG46_9BACT|nr:hypothetical protein OI18_19140 [Flavihumibacter solisilvae]
MVLVSHALSAQFKMIAESTVFEEPEKGFSKILQMKNGYTMFFHITVKDGIDVKLYDEKHKPKAAKHLAPSYGKLKGGSVEGIFEINGDAILMISEFDGRVPTLFRLIVDGKTGELKDTKQVAELHKLGITSGYAMAFGGVPMPDFFVRKDPKSDHYAIAMFNSFESDRNRRIEILYFGPDNKEISHAFYASPEGKYKYMEYLDMAVIGNKSVSILANGFNTRASGGNEKELLLANLDAGAKDVSLTKLDFTKDMVITGGIVRYNPVTKKIVMLASAAKGRRSNQITPFLAIIDPFAKKLEMNDEIYPRQALQKSAEVFGEKRAFWGTPQNLYINNDGSFSVVYEEITNIVRNSGNYTSLSVRLTNVAIANYSIIGTEMGSYFIPKSHYIVGQNLSPFYLSMRDGMGQKLEGGNQFKSFAYLDGTKKSYVLFNDVEENRESSKKGKLTTIQGVSDCDAYFFNISGSDVMPERQFVFGKPESRKEHNLALFTISDYDREKNTLVTLKLENDRGDKGVKVVWMQPE